jgi:hypothetical protein
MGKVWVESALMKKIRIPRHTFISIFNEPRMHRLRDRLPKCPRPSFPIPSHIPFNASAVVAAAVATPHTQSLHTYS